MARSFSETLKSSYSSAVWSGKACWVAHPSALVLDAIDTLHLKSTRHPTDSSSQTLISAQRISQVPTHLIEGRQEALLIYGLMHECTSNNITVHILSSLTRLFYSNMRLGRHVYPVCYFSCPWIDASEALLPSRPWVPADALTLQGYRIGANMPPYGEKKRRKKQKEGAAIVFLPLYKVRLSKPSLISFYDMVRGIRAHSLSAVSPEGRFSQPHLPPSFPFNSRLPSFTSSHPKHSENSKTVGDKLFVLIFFKTHFHFPCLFVPMGSSQSTIFSLAGILVVFIMLDIFLHPHPTKPAPLPTKNGCYGYYHLYELALSFKYPQHWHLIVPRLQEIPFPRFLIFLFFIKPSFQRGIDHDSFLLTSYILSSNAIVKISIFFKFRDYIMDPNKARNEEALSPEELLMFERFIQFHHNSAFFFFFFSKSSSIMQLLSRTFRMKTPGIIIFQSMSSACGLHFIVTNHLPFECGSSSSLIGHQSPVTPFSPVEQLEPSQPLGLSDWINHQSHLGAAHPAYTAGIILIGAEITRKLGLQPTPGFPCRVSAIVSFSLTLRITRTRPAVGYDPCKQFLKQPTADNPTFHSLSSRTKLSWKDAAGLWYLEPIIPLALVCLNSIQGMLNMLARMTLLIGSINSRKSRSLSIPLDDSTAITPQNLLIQGSRNANDGFQTGFLSSGNGTTMSLMVFPFKSRGSPRERKLFQKTFSWVMDGWTRRKMGDSLSKLVSIAIICPQHFKKCLIPATPLTAPNQDAELIALQFGVPNNLDTHNHQNNAAPQTAEGAVYNVPVIPQQVVPAPSQHVTTVPHNGDGIGPLTIITFGYWGLTIAPTSFRCLFEGCRRVFTVKGRPYNFMAHLTCHTETKQAMADTPHAYLQPSHVNFSFGQNSVQCIACTPHHTYRRENECKEHFIAFNPEVQWEKGSHM
ncbi:hypothetical protein VP01_1470g1, partial [Puccinia sorghi]